jgi:AhpD family alkylhydroperoxidase
MRYIKLESGPTRSSPKRKGFQRRYYRKWGAFWTDLKFLLRQQDQIRQVMRSGLIPPAFRERLMLAVTEVNGCRYCRTFHVGQAKQAGIPISEITEYLKGCIPEEVPDEQKLAICYAQHWAENETQADPDLISQMIEAYGESEFQAINILLRMIWMGNLLGNTWDYILFKISFGKLGV